MLKRSGTMATICCALTLLGCAGSLPPVPVIASNGDIAQLAGTWNGTYEMTTGSRRSGSIIFELQAGRDSATGTVIMTYNESGRMHAGLREEEQRIRTTQGAALAISFVRMSGARVTGELASYTDPYCGCRLDTTFTGTLRDNRITGTFVTVHLDSGVTDQGKWKVVRE